MDSDQREAAKIFLTIIVVIVLLLTLVALVLPDLMSIVDSTIEPGLGLKNAAIISFVLTIVIFLVFAVFAGDGLIGEIQFMIGGFFGFFTILWLMLAWMF